MTAYEMLLSESQERMLIVARRGREKELVEIFNKWELDAVVIGKVIEGDRLRIIHEGELKADLPVKALTDEAPKYERPMADSKYQISNSRFEVNPEIRDRESGIDLNEVLRRLLASPNICSKHWVYEQYDSMVRTNTAVLPGADAAVIRIKETRRAIAMCLDGPGRYVAVDAKEGAKLAVAEAARNVVCVGAKPIAVTNCLNFASPERPEVMRSFSDVIDGMKEACEMFETPVVSGNVSFYNETEGRGILPTPTIGMVGLIEDTRRIVTHGFKDEGDVIALLGGARTPTSTTDEGLSVSEYASTILGVSTEEMIATGRLPRIDLALEKQVQETCLKLAEAGLLKSAHDCSEGGLAVAIAESCFSSLGRDAVGTSIDLRSNGLTNEALLFGELPSRIVVSFAEKDLDAVREAVGESPFDVIGATNSDTLKIAIDGEKLVDLPVAELDGVWESSLEAVITS
jgi:phosphoribosylformylglycinamidine synthase